VRRWRVRREGPSGRHGDPASGLPPVDDAHARAVDLAEDSVMGDRLTHGLGRRGHWVDMLGERKGEVNRRRG
jgi:hypothetical protein